MTAFAVADPPIADGSHDDTSDILIGFGEVGIGLDAVLSERRTVYIHDPQKGFDYSHPDDRPKNISWMHIALPYQIQSFATTIVDYIEMFKPGHVVIHSTVPVGTCGALNEIVMFPNIIYSPVRGIHPHLARYLREFPKWFYTPNNLESRAFQSYMARAGIQTREGQSYEAVELQKLWETTEYYVRIATWQEIERQILKLHPPWGSHAESYEKALSDMRTWLFEKRKVYDGDRGFCPIMYGGIVAGHCLEPNLELMKPLATPEFHSWLTTSNELRKKK